MLISLNSTHLLNELSLAEYMPLWWNWQTQGTWLMISIYRNRGSTCISHQKSLGAIPYEFESRQRHQVGL